MRSMTGFGRAEKTLGNYQVTVELKSVNHRYLDARFRLPSSWAALESGLNESLRAECERGSFEVTIRQKLNPQATTLTGNTRFVVDEAALKSFQTAIRELKKRDETTLLGEPSLSDLLQNGRVLIAVEGSDEAAAGLEQVRGVFQEALQGLIKMREVEGKKLLATLNGLLQELEAVTHDVKALASEQPKRLQQKLEARLKQWNLSAPVEPGRLEWEIAMLAEKADITEELDRLAAHFKAFRSGLKGDGARGRRLDFLTQELHREANTIASKAQTLEITQATVSMKSLIEKLREQVQNVE